MKSPDGPRADLTSRTWGQLLVGLIVGALLATVAALLVTDGFINLVLLVLAAGLLFASYAARRYARDELLYRNRDDF